MAHNLHFTNGKADMFYAAKRGLPWHGYGQCTPDAATWADAMHLAQIDWTVTKKQLHAPAGVPVDAWGIFRDDTQDMIGTVGRNYTEIQNIVAGQATDEILELTKFAPSANNSVTVSVPNKLDSILDKVAI